MDAGTHILQSVLFVQSVVKRIGMEKWGSVSAALRAFWPIALGDRDPPELDIRPLIRVFGK